MFTNLHYGLAANLGFPKTNRIFWVALFLSIKIGSLRLPTIKKREEHVEGCPQARLLFFIFLLVGPKLGPGGLRAPPVMAVASVAGHCFQ